MSTADEVGLDLANTPARVSRMYADELLSSYQPGAREKLLRSLTEFDAPRQPGVVALSPIPFASLCAHHVLPFVGKAHIAYIPTTKIFGLSKFARVVDFHARQLQVQERMGPKIADDLEAILQPKGLLVVLEAEHLCMTIRGVKTPDVITRTAEMRGVAEEQAARDEMYRLLRL